MNTKKIMIILDGSSSHSEGLLSFVDDNFQNCIVETASLNIPEGEGKSIGLNGYVNSFKRGKETNSESNVYKIFPNSIIDADLFSRISKYYDFIITTHAALIKVKGSIESKEVEVFHSGIPILLIPEGFFGQIDNILFVNSFDVDPLPVFKNFFYLFPYISGNHRVTLLQMYDESDKRFTNLEEVQNKLSEKKFYEYMSSKCASLSVYKTSNRLNDKDLNAIDFNDRTMIVLSNSSDKMHDSIFGDNIRAQRNISFSQA